MVNKRKQGLTQARAKLTSHRMRSATVGTHVPRRSSRHMNGEAVGFSSPRKRKRAARGIVETILPVTSSGESSSQYARRVSRREFAQDIQRKARIRRIVGDRGLPARGGCRRRRRRRGDVLRSLDAKLGLKVPMQRRRSLLPRPMRRRSTRWCRPTSMRRARRMRRTAPTPRAGARRRGDPRRHRRLDSAYAARCR